MQRGNIKRAKRARTQQHIFNANRLLKIIEELQRDEIIPSVKLQKDVELNPKWETSTDDYFWRLSLSFGLFPCVNLYTQNNGRNWEWELIKENDHE